MFRQLDAALPARLELRAVRVVRATAHEHSCSGAVASYNYKLTTSVVEEYHFVEGAFYGRLLACFLEFTRSEVR
jgi:hypothetical protein